jgi:hypothetical protein
MITVFLTLFNIQNEIRCSRAVTLLTCIQEEIRSNLNENRCTLESVCRRFIQSFQSI